MAPTSSSPSIQTLEALQHTLARQKQAWRQNPRPTRPRAKGGCSAWSACSSSTAMNGRRPCPTISGHRSQHESQLVDVFTSLEAVRHARGMCGAGCAPERRPTSFLLFFPGRNWLIYQPVGVVGVIVP